MENQAMEEKAQLLRHYIANLRREVETEKQNLSKDREASSDDLKGSAHLPTCPMSDLADIDPKCVIHGHLSEQWKSLTSVRGDFRARGLHTIRHEYGAELGEQKQEGAKGDDEVEWMEFADDYSRASLATVPQVLTVPQVPEQISLPEIKRLPSPPPETFLTASQSYMTRLYEVDDMCKEEMSRVNAIVPNLDQLNQLASDWEVKAANSPDFSRLQTDEIATSTDYGDDEMSSMFDGPMPENLKFIAERSEGAHIAVWALTQLINRSLYKLEKNY